MRLSWLFLALVGCGASGSTDPADGSTTNTGCPLERADGVLAAHVSPDGGCSYVCAPVGQQARYICTGNTACQIPNTAANCDLCGARCAGSTPYCVPDTRGFTCSATRSP